MDSRLCFDALQQFAVKTPAFIPVVTAHSRIESNSKQILGCESFVYLEDTTQASEQKAGADKGDDRDGELGGHQGSSQIQKLRPSALNLTFNPTLQYRKKVSARSNQGWSEDENKGGNERDSKCPFQCSQVRAEIEGNIHWKREQWSRCLDQVCSP